MGQCCVSAHSLLLPFRAPFRVWPLEACCNSLPSSLCGLCGSSCRSLERKLAPPQSFPQQSQVAVKVSVSSRGSCLGYLNFVLGLEHLGLDVRKEGGTCFCQDVVIADSLDDGREFAQPACLRRTSLAFASEAALLAIALQVFGVLKELGLKCRTPSGSSTIDECPTHPDIRPAASITEPPAPLQGGDTQRGGDLSGREPCCQRPRACLGLGDASMAFCNRSS